MHKNTLMEASWKNVMPAPRFEPITFWLVSSCQRFSPSLQDFAYFAPITLPLLVARNRPMQHPKIDFILNLVNWHWTISNLAGFKRFRTTTNLKWEKHSMLLELNLGPLLYLASSQSIAPYQEFFDPWS